MRAIVSVIYAESHRLLCMSVCAMLLHVIQLSAWHCVGGALEEW
jgi:hypothetical protein